MHPLDTVIRAALDVLAKFGPTADPLSLAAAEQAIEAGADPALLVVASGEGTPTVLIAMCHPDGQIDPIATVHVAPVELQ